MKVLKYIFTCSCKNVKLHGTFTHSTVQFTYMSKGAVVRIFSSPKHCHKSLQCLPLLYFFESKRVRTFVMIFVFFAFGGSKDESVAAHFTGATKKSYNNKYLLLNPFMNN